MRYAIGMGAARTYGALASVLTVFTSTVSPSSRATLAISWPPTPRCSIPGLEHLSRPA